MFGDMERTEKDVRQQIGTENGRQAEKAISDRLQQEHVVLIKMLSVSLRRLK